VTKINNTINHRQTARCSTWTASARRVLQRQQRTKLCANLYRMKEWHCSWRYWLDVGYWHNLVVIRFTTNNILKLVVWAWTHMTKNTGTQRRTISERVVFIGPAAVWRLVSSTSYSRKVIRTNAELIDGSYSLVRGTYTWDVIFWESYCCVLFPCWWFWITSRSRLIGHPPNNPSINQWDCWEQGQGFPHRLRSTIMLCFLTMFGPVDSLF
jgi:hypothetical protein